MKNISRKIIIGNWKMSLDYKRSLFLAGKINKYFSKKKAKNDILLLPDFLTLPEIIKNYKNKNISYGAQDVSPFPFGAYTGEVALDVLRKIGCKYILIGHSERRRYFFDDQLIARKVYNIIEDSNITPIICVGELWQERRDGKTFDVIKRQLKEAFLKTKSMRGKKIIIAYEPVWAIGTGKTISVAETILVHKKIREILATMFKNNSPSELGIVYGGSINLNNYDKFKNIEDVSGLLIGGASIKAIDFSEIVNNF